MHVPGFKVVAPTNAYDAKGLMTASIRDNNPVMLIEHRLFTSTGGEVREERYVVALGAARVIKSGSDVTIVGISYMALEAFRAAGYLEEVGIDAEVIDPVSLAPLDIDKI